MRVSPVWSKGGKVHSGSEMLLRLPQGTIIQILDGIDLSGLAVCFSASNTLELHLSASIRESKGSHF